MNSKEPAEDLELGKIPFDEEAFRQAVEWAKDQDYKYTVVQCFYKRLVKLKAKFQAGDLEIVAPSLDDCLEYNRAWELHDDNYNRSKKIIAEENTSPSQPSPDTQCLSLFALIAGVCIMMIFLLFAAFYSAESHMKAEFEKTVRNELAAYFNHTALILAA